MVWLQHFPGVRVEKSGFVVDNLSSFIHCQIYIHYKYSFISYISTT